MTPPATKELSPGVDFDGEQMAGRVMTKLNTF